MAIVFSLVAAAWIGIGIIVRLLELAGRTFAEYQGIQIGLWGPLKSVILWPWRLFG